MEPGSKRKRIQINPGLLEVRAHPPLPGHPQGPDPKICRAAAQEEVFTQAALGPWASSPV